MKYIKYTLHCYPATVDLLPTETYFVREDLIKAVTEQSLTFYALTPKAPNGDTVILSQLFRRAVRLLLN